MPNVQVPAATADPTDHADWMELSALLDPRREISAQDLITVIRRTGSSDAVIDADEFEQNWENTESGGETPRLDEAVEREDEELERIAESALEQLARREQYLDDLYPFVLEGALKANPDAARTAYAFLTTVTWFGSSNVDAPESATSLFEYLCAAALVCYLGGTDTAYSYDFGFPRRNGPPAFREAVNQLCQLMGEGGGCRELQPQIGKVKDAKLDLVVWVPFDDHRPNQLSFFGQCSTGFNWRDKINELQPIDFCKTWLMEQPAMNPSLAFFVPRQIKEEYWPIVAHSDRRLVFDRLRISRLLGGLDQQLAQRCAQWTASALV